MWTAEVKIRHG